MTILRVLGLPLLLLLPVPIAAQEFRATIVGRVTDSSGGVMPGVTVTATNVETSVATVAISNESGDYIIPALTPGLYRVEAALDGFRTYVQEGIRLEIQARPTIDIELAPGTVTEDLTVRATPLLETSNASRGEVITGRAVSDMPLIGRNVLTLGALVPGVQFTQRTQAGTFMRTSARFDGISISGGQGRFNEVLLDGVPNTGSDGLTHFVPPVDATQEFKVQTNSFDAEFGRFTGGVINATTKSGTNQLSGSLYEFHRNSALNATDFFADDKPQFTYNLFGGSLGGPVTVPGLYEGRGRTFFFASYEGSREGVSRAFLSTVPTERERQGDFSETFVELPNGEAAPVVVYDPATTRQAGDTWLRDPFPGNRIPLERMDPVARELINLYPQPNAPGDPITGANNYRLSFKDPVPIDGYVFRIDHRLNDRHQSSVRYSRRHFQVNAQGPFQNDVTGTLRDFYSPGISLDHTYTVNKTMFMNARYGFSRFTDVSVADSVGSDLLGLGFPASLVDALPVQALPTVDIDGLTRLSDVNNNKRNWNREAVHTARGSLTKLWGHHTWRLGGEARIMMSESDNRGGAGAGSYSFDQVFTRGPNPQAATQMGGHPLASFLLGLGSGGEVANNVLVDERAPYYAFYAQDDWRVTSKLTVNLGLRYEWEGAYTSATNALNRGFAFDSASPLEADARAAYAANPIPELPLDQFRVQGGLSFAGVDGHPRGLTNLDRNNISPRVGFAYGLTPRTVIRGGYGLFYGPTTLLGETRHGFSVSTPWVTSFDGMLTPSTTLSNPFPNGLQQSSGADLGLMTNVGDSVSFVNPDRTNPYTHQYQVSVQRELPWETLVDVAYTGSLGRSLPVTRELNAIPEPVRAHAREVFVGTGRNILNDSVPNPFDGLITSGPLSGATTTRGQLLRPYPQFTSVEMFDDSIGTSRYDAFQLKVSRRFSEAFSLLAAYTASRHTERTRFLNDTDLEPIEEASAFDVPHLLTVSTTWELPFGPGRRFLGDASGLAGKILEGYQLNVIYSAGSGIPLNFSGAELVGDPSLPASDRTIERYFDTGAFRQRETLELVGLARTTDVRAPGKNNVDLSLFKTTSITAGVQLQIRVEAFNAFNHPEFLEPNSSFGNPNFGRITALNTFTRQIQFGARLIW
ncbi:MAG: TonB-dependent receptor plug domain-containing protein [Luteitalea sp.]|nr:TonB-dependent receptor plug domain-containing protein [Luteitalea sp.]